MSKFSEALQKRRSNDGARPLGFGSRDRKKERALLLGAAASDQGQAKAALEAGCDFVLISASDGTSAANAAKGLEGIVGARVERLAADDLEALRESDVDFVAVSPANAPASAADEESLGLVLPAGTDEEEGALRARSSLNADAILVERETSSPTLAERLALVRVATLAGAPLLVPIAVDAPVADLRALRDSGAGAALVPGDTAATNLAALIERLEAVPPAKRRSEREQRGIAIVPSLAGGGSEVDEPEDE